MQIVIHVNGYYDWEPVPADVEVTDADIEAMRVKAGQNGTWLMKVEKTEGVETHTTIALGEEELFPTIVGEMTRGDKQPLTRNQAIHRYISRIHLDHNTHPDWMLEIEADLGEPNEAGLRDYLAMHVSAGNISVRDVERLVAKYLEPTSSADLVDHLHDAYAVDPAKIAARQARGEELKAAREAAHAAHLKQVAKVAEESTKAFQARKKNKKGVA